MANCPTCNNEARFIQEYNAWYCDTCEDYLPSGDPGQGGGQPAQAQAQPHEPEGGTMAQRQFSDTKFTITQKVISIASKYYVHNSREELVGFVQQKMFKLKEDVRVYLDEEKTTEIMRIQQANILDFSGSFQVVDSQTNYLIGILKRKGWKSILKDEWKILDPYQNEIGIIREDGGIVWMMRRFLPPPFKWIPYHYHLEIGGQEVGTVTEKFKIIGDEYEVSLVEGQTALDPRLAVAIGLMMDIGEHE